MDRMISGKLYKVKICPDCGIEYFVPYGAEQSHCDRCLMEQHGIDMKEVEKYNKIQEVKDVY